MMITRGALGILLSIFISASFLAGVYTQIYGEFYLGTGIVLLTLCIELAREISKLEGRKKLRWRDVVGLGVGTLLSIGGLMFITLLTLVFGGRTLHILLLDSALSSMVFLLSSFLRFWSYWRR